MTDFFFTQILGQNNIDFNEMAGYSGMIEKCMKSQLKISLYQPKQHFQKKVAIFFLKTTPFYS